MKRLTVIVMLVGFVLVSTPHMLCPLTCGHGQTAASPEQCPHCRSESPTPKPAPSDDCDSPCCDSVHAVVVDISRSPALSATLATFVIGDAVAILPSPVVVAAGSSWALDPFLALQRPGCALILLLARLLL